MKIPKGWIKLKRGDFIRTGDKLVRENGTFPTTIIKTNEKCRQFFGQYIRRKKRKVK